MAGKCPDCKQPLSLVEKYIDTDNGKELVIAAIICACGKATMCAGCGVATFQDSCEDCGTGDLLL